MEFKNESVTYMVDIHTTNKEFYEDVQAFLKEYQATLYQKEVGVYSLIINTRFPEDVPFIISNTRRILKNLVIQYPDNPTEE